MKRGQDAVEILLVEDIPADAELIIHVLRKYNPATRLVWVKDGAEALDFVFSTGDYAERDCSSEPKLVLLDLRLPRVSGIEVLRRLKSDERTRSVPVVVLTASKKDADAKECCQLGVNGYIAKPLLLNDVIKVVRDLELNWLSQNKVPPE